LLAILLPSLQKSKETAQRIVCMSNLKTQHTACTLYVTDYDDRLPTTYYYWAWGGKQGKEAGTTKQDKFLNPYVGRLGNVDTDDDEKVLQVFSCPSDKGTYYKDPKGSGYGAWPVDRTPSWWDSVGVSYHYNSAALSNDYERGLHGKKLSKVRSSSELIMVGDGTIVTFF
jgi:hypothetical protein